MIGQNEKGFEGYELCFNIPLRPVLHIYNPEVVSQLFD